MPVLISNGKGHASLDPIMVKLGKGAKAVTTTVAGAEVVVHGALENIIQPYF